MNIEILNKRIKELNKLKKLLKLELTVDDNVNEIIFKKYLEVENVTKVSKYVNELGYRIKLRRYIANDISDVITDKNISIKNNELKLIVYRIFQCHKKGKAISW